MFLEQRVDNPTRDTVDISQIASWAEIPTLQQVMLDGWFGRFGREHGVLSGTQISYGELD